MAELTMVNADLLQPVEGTVNIAEIFVSAHHSDRTEVDLTPEARAVEIRADIRLADPTGQAVLLAVRQK